MWLNDKELHRILQRGRRTLLKGITLDEYAEGPGFDSQHGGKAVFPVHFRYTAAHTLC